MPQEYSGELVKRVVGLYKKLNRNNGKHDVTSEVAKQCNIKPSDVRTILKQFTSAVKKTMGKKWKKKKKKK